MIGIDPAYQNKGVTAIYLTPYKKCLTHKGLQMSRQILNWRKTIRFSSCGKTMSMNYQASSYLQKTSIVLFLLLHMQNEGKPYSSATARRKCMPLFVCRVIKPSVCDRVFDHCGKILESKNIPFIWVMLCKTIARLMRYFKFVQRANSYTGEDVVAISMVQSIFNGN